MSLCDVAAKPCTLTLPGILTVVQVIFHHLSKFFLQNERLVLNAESNHAWAQQAVTAMTLVQLGRQHRPHGAAHRSSISARQRTSTASSYAKYLALTCS